LEDTADGNLRCDGLQLPDGQLFFFCNDWKLCHRQADAMKPTPRQGAARSPRFPLGCQQYGAISNTRRVVITEGAVRAYHTTMSEKEREEFREVHYRFDLRVFPDALRGEAQKEFPGEEFVKAMRHYVDKHPELVLQPFPL
jgi:hypothetical protein